MTDCIIELKGLTKAYQSKAAVQKVDLSIYRGEIFGLIGHNGAGKSTLLKMIGGLIYPTSGEIRFFNRPAGSDPALFDRLGLLIEHAGLYPNYTAYENLELLAIAYGIKGRRSRINGLLELVGLTETGKKKVKNYSMGMKQRLGIAMALLGSPDVLILDEPINGLDPQGIVEIRNMILELNRKGLTIIISSHILEELSKIATKYGIIHQGRLVEVITKDELMEKCGERIEIEVEEAGAAVPVLEEQLHIESYKVLGPHTVHVYDKHVESRQINEALVRGGVAVHSIAKHKQGLEEYFLERTEGGSGSHV
jgi:ABC-2 type transport system ATP-binding protein